MDVIEVTVLLINVITLLGNLTIILTLMKSRSFSRSIRLHLGVITLLDSINAVALTLRYFLDSYDLFTLTSCKVSIALIGCSVMAMFCVNVSMTTECLALLHNADIDGRYHCLRFKSWRPARKGFIVVRARSQWNHSDKMSR